MTARNANVDNLLRECEARGWRVRRGGHGYVARCPADCRCQISIAKTPGGWRYLRNVVAELKRCRAWNIR